MVKSIEKLYLCILINFILELSDLFSLFYMIIIQELLRSVWALLEIAKPAVSSLTREQSEESADAMYLKADTLNMSPEEMKYYKKITNAENKIKYEQEVQEVMNAKYFENR